MDERTASGQDRHMGTDADCNDGTVMIELNLETAWNALITGMRLFLGGWMIVSGYSHWAPKFGLLPGFPQPLGTLPLSNQMLVTMIEIGLFDIVKAVEIIGGLCLVLGLFVPAATLLLLPVSAIVFYNAIFLNLRVDRMFSPTYMGVMCLYMNILIAVAHVRYYVPMLAMFSSPGTPSDLRLLTRIYRRSHHDNLPFD